MENLVLELVNLVILTFFGENCNIPCSCVRGRCEYGPYSTGKCYCPPNYIGEYCDAYLTYLNGSYIFNSSIGIKDNSVSFIFSNLSISESVNVEDSELIISNSYIFIKENFTLSNSHLILTPNNLITVDGCINLIETNITVNLSGLTETDYSKKIILLNSTIGCLNIESLKIFLLNELPKCKILQEGHDSSSISITIISSECDFEEGEALGGHIVLIIIGSAFGLVIIIIIMVVVVPSVREKIFPRIKFRRAIQKKQEMMQLNLN